jgi:hypothetical protein
MKRIATSGHGPFIRRIWTKKQLVRRKAMLLIVVAAIVLVTSLFVAFIPGKISSTKRLETIHFASHRFTILDESKLAISDRHTKSNQLKKSFLWYRQHWYKDASTGHRHDQESESTTIWEKTDLPHWMKEYFSWHRQHTSKKPAQPNSRYLILQCLEQDKQCGGLADRLMALPFLILLASQSRRILLIVWTVPFPLEEFLMPPTKGVDWMMPAPSSSVGAEMTQEGILSAPSLVDKTVFTRITTIVPAAHNKSLGVVRVRIQDYWSAWEYYDQHQPNSTDGEDDGTPLTRSKAPSLAEKHFRDIFWCLFEPSPPLSTVMKQRQTLLDFQKHPFVVAHYRALYGPQSPSMAYIRAASGNAVNCASELMPGAPVVFLSDSFEARQRIHQISRTSKHNKTVIIPSSNHSSLPFGRSPLHLDKATRGIPYYTNNYEPADFYDTFLDVMLMAKASCVAFGQGGFGRMGSLLSRNHTCTKRHFENAKLVACKWRG